MAQSNKFYKNEESDKVLWFDTGDSVGEFLFSFDGKKIYNLFRDYPDMLSDEEKELFDKENPQWKKFFSDRR